ncbi:MAG: hypothetical protein KGD68_12750 [Candidatus Lokiarchaeota archaeon]|nr:hypothetical protein [Candidatus Lokiarchaeota archaeon]
MKKSKILNILLIFILLVINLDVKSLESFANPLPAPEIPYMGGIIYDNNNSLNLVNADVVFTIDSTDFQNDISVLFDGYYTIHNPTNTTANVTIYAPFSYQMSTIESDWQVEVNSIPTEFSFVWHYSLNSNLSSYFENYTSNIDFYIVINTTILKENSQVISYRFYRNTKNPLYNTDYFSIRYILGTARAWKNNITEKVEFKVQGKQPTSYTEYTEKVCNISTIPDGKSYSWVWDNESINDDYVGINYRGRLLKPVEVLFYIILLGSIGIGGVTLLVFLIVRKKRKKKSRNL